MSCTTVDVKFCHLRKKKEINCNSSPGFSKHSISEKRNNFMARQFYFSFMSFSFSSHTSTYGAAALKEKH